MTERHRPIPPTTFPATRLGILLGVAVGLGGAVLHTKQPPPVVEIAPLPLAARPIASSAAPQQAAEPPRLTARPQGPVVVNVWLQGCADCMPKFEAWRQLRAGSQLVGLPIVNVAYGSATTAFAQQYRVDDALYVDADGSILVRPLGVGTFTTFIINERGTSVWAGNPTSPTYVADLWATWNAVKRNTPLTPFDVPASDAPASDAPATQP